MVTYVCEKCNRTFLQKSHYDDHQSRKRPCKKDNTIEALVEKKVKEALTKTNEVQKIEHKEIVELADKYLLILELRSFNSEFMQTKFKDLKDNYKSQLNLFENENKKGLRGFFR